jgi:hypothetical protein
VVLTAYCNDEVVYTQTSRIVNNQDQVWNVEFTKAGSWKLSVGIPEYELEKILDGIEVSTTTNMPLIDETDSSLQLYFTAKNRSNTEAKPNTWKYKDIEADFTNFNWNSNGWITDSDGVTSLHLSNGAKVTIPFAPFAAANTSGQGAQSTGKTIELIFKISNVRDMSARIIEIASWNANGVLRSGIVGLGDRISLSTRNIQAYLTPEQQAALSAADLIDYQTRNQTRAYITQDQRIHVAFSVQNNRSDSNRIIYTYINGVISGLVQYSTLDMLLDDGTPSNMVIDSSNADIDLYAIRVYSKYCGDSILLNNYAADLPTPAERLAFAANNDALNNGDLSLTRVQQLGNIPYIVFTDLRQTGSKKGKNKDGSVGPTGTERRLPLHKKDFRWAPCYFVDPEDAKHIDSASPTGYEEGYTPRSFGDINHLVNTVIYAQGTSSLAYAVKNLRLRFVNKPDYYSLRPAIPIDGLDSPDGTIRELAQAEYDKFENIPKVALFTLKKDFMDSSMAHNTGVGNMLTALYSDIGLKTAAQQKYPDKTIINNIVGFPCLAFWQTGDGTDSAVYIGRYNFNTDKDSKDDAVLFGFTPSVKDKFGVLLDENNEIKSGFMGTLDEEYDSSKQYYT